MCSLEQCLVTVLAAGATPASTGSRGRHRAGLLHNLHTFSAPSAGSYDALAAPLLGPVYARVARRVVDLKPRGRVLEIGPGPGHLGVKLARLAPGLTIAGVDISPDMAERARARSVRAGLDDRVTCHVGDVAALPFRDRTFDLAVSTFSLHHWEDPARGLAEVYRVLRPDGTLLLYDVEDWVHRLERASPRLVEVASLSPFQDRGTWEQQVVFSIGPVPVIFRAELRRGQEQ